MKRLELPLLVTQYASLSWATDCYQLARLINFFFFPGIGVGLAMSAAFVALNHYFSKKRGQAVGLSMAGTALGMLIMPQLVRYLLEEFSFRGAVLILAGLALHSAVGSILLQPVKWHLKDEELDYEMIEADIPTLGIIQEDEGDEDSLPEIQTLLFNSRKGENRERKISDNSNGGLTVPNGLTIPKRPTFPRITSSNSIIPKRIPTLPKITSQVDMNNMLRKRKESVISSLSQLDFSGSCLQIHLEVSARSRLLHKANRTFHCRLATRTRRKWLTCDASTLTSALRCIVTRLTLRSR